MAKKVEYFGINQGPNKKKDVVLPQADELVNKTNDDGIYIDGPLLFKNKDMNV